MARNPIVFSNGTLVSNAKVNVEGTIYDVEPAQYEGTTPLSASNLNQLQTNLYDYVDAMINVLYPVGSYYETSDDNFDPNVVWGGTWVLDSQGRVTVSQDTSDTDFDTLGETGGEKTHQLTINEMPSHQHSAAGKFVIDGYGGESQANISTGTAFRVTSKTAATGGSQAHNNVQPYVVVKRWHRTA